ncbi:MAG: hypothetical protein JOZ18_22375 [Chloroflexi bacterium]|nr:hypothetical protein [Chloroflexota bacterium]
MNLLDALTPEQITALLGRLDQAVRDHDQLRSLMTAAELQEIGQYYYAMKEAERGYSEAWQTLIDAGVRVAFDETTGRHVWNYQ